MSNRDLIENVNNFEKDRHSRAIVNTDSNALRAYKIQREKMIKFNRISDLEIDVTNIKNDIDEIKSLLHQLINNK